MNLQLIGGTKHLRGSSGCKQEHKHVSCKHLSWNRLIVLCLLLLSRPENSALGGNKVELAYVRSMAGSTGELKPPLPCLFLPVPRVAYCSFLFNSSPCIPCPQPLSECPLPSGPNSHVAHACPTGLWHSGSFPSHQILTPGLDLCATFLVDPRPSSAPLGKGHAARLLLCHHITTTAPVEDTR